MLGALLTVIILLVLLGLGLGIWAELRRQTVGQIVLGLIDSYKACYAPTTTTILQTVLWLALLIPLIDHVTRPRGSWTGQFMWALTIIPHEAGHLICNPFGLLLMFWGGSFWQVAIWVMVGGFYLVVRRRTAQALLAWMIAGHSCINVAVYLRDAQERDLPLLFGMSTDHHDWWNILSRLGLLNYDNLLADMTSTVGVLIVLGCIGLGVVRVWRNNLSV